MKDKVIVHLEIEDCVQDCPFCRSAEGKFWLCTDMEPSQFIEGASMKRKTTPPDWCPFRSMG